MTLTIKDYPMQNITPSAEGNEIMWIFTGKWSMIDNFAPTPVTVDIGHGKQWYATSEHAFAAAKADSRPGHDLVASQVSPGAAKMKGRRVRLRADWEDVKFDVMWKVLRAKFEQNPEALRVLLETGDRPIYEGNTWDDRIWGVTRSDRQDGSWVGRNALGIQLMALRKELRQ